MKEISIFDKVFEVLDLSEVDEYSNPKAFIKLSNGKWDWFIVACECEYYTGDVYCFGLVNGFEKELGFFYLSEVFDVGAWIVEDFVPIGVFDIFPDFDLR